MVPNLDIEFMVHGADIVNYGVPDTRNAPELTKVTNLHNQLIDTKYRKFDVLILQSTNNHEN